MIKIQQSSKVTKKEAITKLGPGWKEVEEVGVVERIDKIIVKIRQVNRDSIDRNSIASLQWAHLTKANTTIKKEWNSTKKRSKVISLLAMSKLIPNTKEKTITKDEGMITTIANSTSTIKNSTIAKMTIDKQIDQNTTITRITKTDRINASTSQKNKTMKVTMSKTGSMKGKTRTSLQLMIQGNLKNSTKIVGSTRLKTRAISKRIWILATKRCSKKWKVKRRHSKSKSKFHPKIDSV